MSQSDRGFQMRELAGAQSELPGSEQIFPEGRQRTTSEGGSDMQRQRTNTFKYVFCDYDISQMPSSAATNSEFTEASEYDFQSIQIVRDEKWYDKSSAAYFTSKQTRNAQTVSLRQRHRPIFQLWLDLLTSIMIGAVLILASITKVRELNELQSGQISQHDFLDIMQSQVGRAFACIFFLLKFLALCTWYRCTSKGNILERTGCLFWVRFFIDLIPYAFVSYCLYLEYNLTEENQAQAEVANVVFDPASPVQTDLQAKNKILSDEAYDFLEKLLVENQGIMELHKTHWILIAFLLFKEICVYFFCVRRAYNKLAKEQQDSSEKSQRTIVEDRPNESGLDGFLRDK